MAFNAAGISAFLLVPKHRRREAHVVFLFQQLITWALGLCTVEFGLLKYPVHELHKANYTSITFEYFIYPTVAVYFNLYYPSKRAVWLRLCYYAAFAASITGPEVLIEHTTRLIHYTGWHWYYTTVSITATLLLSRLFYSWYFIKGDPAVGAKRKV